MKEKLQDAFPSIIVVIAIIVASCVGVLIFNSLQEEAYDKREKERLEIYEEAYQEGYMAAANEYENTIEEAYIEGYHDGYLEGHMDGTQEAGWE